MFFLICMLQLSLAGMGQGLSGGPDGESNRIGGKIKFIPIPYVNYDRALGFMVGGVPMVMFNPVKKDTISPSSLIGGVGMYSTNKTWFLMGFGVFFFDEDNWRLTTAAGVGNVNFQFYLDNPINSWIPYQTEADFAMVKIEHRIYERLYGGLSYVYADMVTSVANLPLTDSLTLHGIGLNLSMDERSSQYYPRSGYYTNLKYYSYPEWFQNESTSKKIEFDFNQYFSLRDHRDVVAARFFAGLGIGDLSFNQQFIVKDRDVRGYTQGAYRGNYLLALQGEYRWNFHRRWGVVGYFGVATVFKAINKKANGKLLPGIGTGFRFKAFEETNFTVGMDVATGIDDWGICFRIGEAF